MKRLISLIFLLSNILASGQFYYGTYYGANTISNIHIGLYGDQQVSYRFRAGHSGEVTDIHCFIATGTGYSYGDGGILKVTLETDDGTVNHLPSGVVLASVTDPNPLHWEGAWPEGAVANYYFDSPANVTEGALYHIRFSNLDADPKNNCVSVNTLFSKSGVSDRMPVTDPMDLAVLKRYSSGNWEFESYNTPVFTLDFVDGMRIGQGYIYSNHARFPYNITGSNYKLRNRITVSGESKTVNKVWARVAKKSGTEDLNIRLEQSNGLLIEEVSVPASDIGSTEGWVSRGFSKSHILSVGSTYNVVLSTGLNTTYVASWLQEGSSYYKYLPMFPDGVFGSTTNGTTWKDESPYRAEIFFETGDLSSLTYVSSVVENNNPSVLDMKYNLDLADIIPAVSAFIVIINSIVRPVSTATVSGSHVLLSLSDPVLYGDTITVAYNKPSTNALQAVSGEQASSFSAQSVINKVATLNKPPVIALNYQSNIYSGFIGEINADGSYDTDNDNLTFYWITPENVPVSSSSNSIIKYLGPIVTSTQTVVFTLNLSDGKTNQIRSLPIQIMPYRPELETAEISNIEASSFEGSYYPGNAADGNLSTIWSAKGNDQWLIFKLKQPFRIQHVMIAFNPMLKAESFFEVYCSADGLTWEQALTNSVSCSFSGNFQVFVFPPSMTGKEFNYVKFVGESNSADLYNYISEFKIYGYNYQNPDSAQVKVYPNPAKEFVNIWIDKASKMVDSIRLIDMAGKELLRVQVDPVLDLITIPIPTNLLEGTYLLMLDFNKTNWFTQKLVIVR